jgi:hypothetical protein
MAKSEAVTGEGHYTCDCGRTFTHGAWYTKHKLHCNGKPATEGRIAARSRALVPVSRPRAKAQKRTRHVDRTPPTANGVRAIQVAATDKAVEIVIAGLTAKRDAIDRAIAALQAVS